MPSPGYVQDRPSVLGLDEVGSAPAVAGLVVKTEAGPGPVRQTQFTLTSVPVTVTRTGATNASGSVQLYDLPQGLINVLGVCGSLAVTGFGTGSVAIVYSVGSVAAAADATLTSTEADVHASTASSALTSGAGTLTYKGGSIAVSGNGILDGTSTAKDLYLNFASGNDIVAGGTAYLTGTLVVTWMNYGKTS